MRLLKTFIEERVLNRLTTDGRFGTTAFVIVTVTAVATVAVVHHTRSTHSTHSTTTRRRKEKVGSS